MNREITEIIIHCSRDPKNSEAVDLKTIDRRHRLEQRLSIGYHYLIRRCGTMQAGRPISQPGLHTRGHNKNSIAICLVGGVDSNGKEQENFTSNQLAVLKDLIQQLLALYPSAEVKGHRDLDKAHFCPSMDVAKWWKEQTNDQ